MAYKSYINEKNMLFIIIGYMKLAKGIFALGKGGKVSTQTNLDGLDSWAESDRVKFSRNKQRILKLPSRKTTNNSLIKIIPGFSSQGA